jgi:hypothetical protein
MRPPKPAYASLVGTTLPPAGHIRCSRGDDGDTRKHAQLSIRQGINPRRRDVTEVCTDREDDEDRCDDAEDDGEQV